jgi:hypothetical protein
MDDGVVEQVKEISVGDGCGDPTGASQPQAGDRMPDGTVCAGISPDSGEPFYAAAADEPLMMTWAQANEAAAKSKAHGRKGWRLPTKDEQQVLYSNRHRGALARTFNETGAAHAGRYWSCTERPRTAMFSIPGCAWVQEFGVVNRGTYYDGGALSVRLVRD